MVEALRYNQEGRGFDSRCGHRGRTLALGSTVFLREGKCQEFLLGGGGNGQCVGLMC